LWAAVGKIDRYGVELRGIERVPPNERVTTQSVWDCCWMWLAANTTISTFALGTLGPSVFFLGFKESALIIVFFNLLSTIPVAYFSTFGFKMGLRQMTITRFSFGYYTALLPVALNVIACIGWACINLIVGGQVLNAVGTSHIPNAAAIVILAIITFVVSLFGYKHVHLYERYSWIPIAIIFIIMLGLSAQYMEAGEFAGSGPVEAGAVLSFGASICGFAVAWGSYAADYTVKFPEDTSATKVFWLTYLGLNTPMILIELLGAGMTTVTRADWQAQFQDGGVGGLMAAGLSRSGGFGQFLLVLLGLSVIANNIPNMYSLALTAQVLGKPIQAIPRVFLVLIGSIVSVILAIIGTSHFFQWLDTFLVLLSYWLVIYCAIVIEEHLIFRKGKWSNYNPDDYVYPDRLPLGIAAAFASGFGVMGAVFGMATLWYIGIIGRQIGDPAFGGDVGFELSFAFTAITFPIFRYVEKLYEKKIGRYEEKVST